MKKVLRKLIPSIIMMLIAAAFVGTSTFAWFSMNRSVTVTGMSVDTRVDDNLKVSATNQETASATDYDVTLNQVRSGHLRPVSTVDGVTFYYTGTDNVNEGTGAAKNLDYTAYSEAVVADPSNSLPNANAGKTTYDAAFQTNYGITDTITTTNVAYGYIDYSFYIKATNVSGSAEDLKLTKLNLVYNPTVSEVVTPTVVTEKAWRVAVFSQTATKNTALDTAPTTSDRKALLTMSGSAQNTTGKAVNSASTLGDVSYTDEAWAIDSIAAGATEYNKVTVRLWLEGEDTTCNTDTFATLTAAYKLSLQFHIGGSEPAVLNIGSVAA